MSRDKVRDAVELVALTETAEIDKAFELLQSRMKHGATEHDLTLLIPAHHTQRQAYWHEREAVWGILYRDDDDSRYLCTYDVINPAERSAQRQRLMINVRRTGDLWSVAGAFGKDKQGHVYYLHSPSPSKVQQIAQQYPAQQFTVKWGNGRTTDAFAVGRLDDRRFISLLATYVRAVLEPLGNSVEAYYRNAIIQSVAEALQDLESQVHRSNGGSNGHAEPVDSVARIRLNHLTQLHYWLLDDNDLLQTTVARLSSQEVRNRRRRYMLSATAAVVSILAGWLLSSVSPMTLLHLFSR